MESADVRKNFILTTTGNYFGLSLTDPLLLALQDDQSVNTFLDSGNCQLLGAHMVPDEGRVVFNTKVDSTLKKDKLLVFFKVKPDVITGDNLADVFVSSMIDSPVSSLYHSLQKLYAPILLKDSEWSGTLDPKLQSLLTELSDGLGSLLRKQDPNVSSEFGHASTRLAGILSFKDETDYWADTANNPMSREEKEMAQSFYHCLEPVSKEFSGLDAVAMVDAEDILENAQNCLDELWRFDFPQARMSHLLGVIANQLSLYVQSKVGEEDIWGGQYNQVEKSLSEGISICDRWVDTCHKLTSMFWKSVADQMWEGKPFIPDYCKNVSKRLNEILSLRTLHKQLTRLLSLSEQEDLKTAEAFKPFTGLKPVQYNPYTEPLWQAAVRQFENSLKPAEQRIAGKLRAQLRNMNSSAYQLMQEFKRYKELIKRDSIQKELVAEREMLLSELSSYVRATQADFNNTSVNGPRRMTNVPEVVSNIYWVKPIHAKVLDIGKTADTLLMDLIGYEELKRNIGEFCVELEEYHNDQFNSWSREMLHMIDTQELSLATDSPVLSFSKGRLLRVNYNPRLVGLVREVSQLSILGHNIHPNIIKMAKLAQKFVKQAKALEEIANFHNTIGDQMIPSQRPMMLEAALALSGLVQEQTTITWSNTEQLDAYIAKLKIATKRLAQENKQLAQCHLLIKERVLALMNTDLLRHQSKWKELLKEMRSIMHQLQEKGFADQKSWCSHWDRQLYKALEHQYQLGLEALNQHLPELKVEITFRQQRLQFLPPMEEIRMKYYGQLKRFLAIPFQFKGVNEVNEHPVFPTIVDRNAHRFSQLFQRAEELFERLENIKERFADLCALGSCDVEQLVEKYCRTAEDWDRNFRASKAKGQEIGKLPGTEERIDCFSISFQPLRVELEIMNRRYWDILVQSLHNAIIKDINTIEKFTEDAIDVLKRQPQTVEEIANASNKHAEYAKLTEEMVELFNEAERKNKTLASWTKERVEQVSRVTMQWDNFKTLMENHEQIVAKQIEAIKGNLESQTNSFNSEVEKFGMRWFQLRPQEDKVDGDVDNMQAAISFIAEKRLEWNQLMETRDSLRKDYEHFNMGEPFFPEIDGIEADLNKHEQTWGLFDEFNTSMQEFSDEEWIVFRSKTYKFEEFLNNWGEKLRLSGETTSVTVRLIHELEKYKTIIPVLKYVRGEVFSEKHWIEMYSLLGIPTNLSVDKLTFGHFLKVRDALLQHNEALKEMNSKAAGEIVIRQALGELDVWEVDARFNLVPHIDSAGNQIMLIKEWKDIINKVGDHQSLLQSLKDSTYFSAFADRARVWEQRLADLDEYLTNLNQIQRKWVYLEPIFGRGALPNEQGRFRRVDDDFKSIMSDVARDNKVVSLCRINGIRNTLATLLDQLARCQKSLNEFLEEKRSAFPRFYFIGDDDLLEILGQATNPEVIQSHLKKLFAGIHFVRFDENNSHIVAMKSLEGEDVPLKRPVEITTQVEDWLRQLSEEMKMTLRQLLSECLEEGRSDAGMDPLKSPSQILCLADAILFTERCDESIREGRLTNYKKELETKLESYTSVDLSSDGTPEGKTDSHVLELKLKALILDTIHNIDVVEILMQNNTTSVSDWAWQKQLRFYVGEGGSAYMKMVDAQFDYTFEYQGNTPKLVHTPLTDKCYLTLTQGMHMGMGGNPYGPAGTGKTESVKALGGLFGRQVLVFNCDEGIDVKSMGRIFVGLVKCGAWGCFDEFNRLEEAVLSAVSMQIQTIQATLKSQGSSTSLLGKEVPVDPNSGIFITMNPAGKGYGGRQKLPDNLKQLFRPVAMARPDNELIAEVILFSEGFKNAKSLGRKLVAIFNLSKELLTPQQHYDWGLRALKTVLKGSGNLLQTYRRSLSEEEKSSEVNVPANTESELVVQALRLNTLSKLTFSDSSRFDELVQDVFPDVKFRGVGYEDLAKILQETFIEMSLIPNDRQIKKALELYEQLQQRMGVVIVGPSGSGKTTLWQTLCSALLKLDKKVKKYVMNPKAMPRQQLLGHIDHDTREWSDGVLTASARQVVREPPDVTSWIICDGDIDPEWIESLNSVLDDNRLLTMPSGERIQFGPNVNFLFETHDLSSASPATISRMGMIFLSDEDTNIHAVVNAWLDSQGEEVKRYLEPYIEQYFHQAITWVLKAGEAQVDTTLVGWVLNGLSHLNEVTSKAHFALALVRGLGGNLPETTREAFAREVYSWVGEHIPDQRKPLNIYYDPTRDRLESYTSDSTDQVVINATEVSLILTADAKCSLDYFMPWLQLETSQPFILVGPEGCGKSLLLHHCFSRLRSTQVTMIHCSAYTAPQHVLQKLSQMCMVISTNTGRVYRPKDCEKLIVYLKDLNLPKPDKWGTCQLITFLQQVVTYKGFYDHNLEWVGLEGVQVVASMTSGSALGRHKLSTRFTSIVRIASIGYPEREQLVSVYSAYLQSVLETMCPEHPAWGSQTKAQQLATSMVNVYQNVRDSFSVDDYSHYLFTPRDLTRWVLGLLRYQIPSSDATLQPLMEVWVYEACRLFRDKLAEDEDIQKFDLIIISTVQSDWGMDLRDHLVDTYYVTPAAGVVTAGAPLPMHGYELGHMSMEDWNEMVERSVMQYSREKQELHLLVFTEVLEAMARVDRILTSPGGSLLLAGRSGVGRRTAVSVIAHLHGIRVVSPAMSLGYNTKNFKNDLKQVMQSAGVEGEQVLLLLEDHHLVSSAFLEIINSLLMAGEVPGLYTPEELDPLLMPLRDQAAHENFRGSQYAYFASRVLRNLHIALIMDSSNQEFSAQCESNPALYKQCSVLWMEGWAQKTMIQIPDMLLSDNEKDKRNGPEFLNSFLAVHESLPTHLATPRRYLGLLHTYRSIHNTKKEGVLQRQQHLKAGVAKLNEAQEVVSHLKAEAAEKEAVLAEKQAEATHSLQLITDTMKRANDQKVQMVSLKDQTLLENKKIAERKIEIDEELAEIEPLVREAKEAVGNIKADALSEIRSLRAPPVVIRDILEGVLRLMGVQDTSWNSMKTFLAQRGIKEEIRNYDPRDVSIEGRKSVEKLLVDRSSSFDPATAKRASTAAAPLAAWVKANVRFSYVLEKVKPLEKEQNILQRNLERAEVEIGELSSGLDDVDKKVAKLTEKMNRSTKEAAEVEFHLNKAKETISAAESLVTKLEGEYQRWSQQVSELDSGLSGLPREALLAASFITYLSEAPEDKRKATMAHWSQLLEVSDFDLRKFLSSEREQLQWKAEGLPSDQLSIENALVILQTEMRPFLIDPSSRATTWLREHLRGSTVEVTTQQDAKFATTLELAVRFGKTLIIQEVDKVEPLLFPLLRGDLINQGPRYVVELGEKTLDYNENFHLFLVTRNPDPELPPDAVSILTSVNFTTTRAGLTGQLLAATLQVEKPELEVRRTDLLRQEEDLKIQLVTLEEQLLTTLAESQGNILENKELLASLEQAKSSAATIESSLKESGSLQESLENERKAYLPLAQAASNLYFVITDLGKLNNMYRFSLNAFHNLFHKALQTPQDGSNTDQRIRSLQRALIDLVYSYISRSLFKADRLMFALHLVHGMYPELFQANEWEALTGQLVTDIRMDITEIKKALPKWVDEERAFAVALLKQTFPAMYEVLHLDDLSTWSGFARSSHCETDIPVQLNQKLSGFQQLLVIQAIRPDRLQSAMVNFANRALGMKELSPPALNLRRLLPETTAGEPILIIISPGADPSQELLDLVKNTVGNDSYNEVAMGQGQSEIAIKFLRESATAGHWLCLKNLHLVTAWLPTLEKELNSLQPHSDFRLWLTAEPHAKFTPIILQISLKVTYEAPAGIKKNLHRTYDSWSPEIIARGNNVNRAQALFVLAWFHAVVQERRTYIPQGWSKFYEFSLADLKAGADILDRLYKQEGTGDIKWNFIHGLFENAIYGGRIDNIWDMRVLSAYLYTFFTNDVIGGRKPAPTLLAQHMTLPTTVNFQDYTALIRSLPEEDDPAYFGLPANIERSWQRIVSSQVIAQLKVLMRSPELASRFDREKWHTQLSPMLNLWKKLNQGTNLIQAKVALPGASSEPPVRAFLHLEHYSVISIVQTIHRALAQLSKVIRGTLLLTADVQKLADSLLRQETPGSWQKLWDGPEDPLEYLRSLIRRALGIEKWVLKSDQSTLLREALDLSELLHPATFLNALRQQTAREYGTSMDNLEFITSWSRGGIPDAKVAIKWSALQLEGATFDGSRLMHNNHDSPSITVAPMCTVAWMPKDLQSRVYQEELLSIPVYSSSDREHLVGSIDIPCHTPHYEWRQAGLAVFLIT
ncbi:cytoplasmic dynein 2 heavy chain 1-like isoform X2 [Homarus americanus]|uniref:cytoplasmic dynein 2 heavy chain 1-like isoform X2 n=1 Tax=Homarus americanus TaxID=6706 RepID=UPI001C490C2F|nr:cytoplasmic dynein 2 heavy chain 1-like isoform X2 [Homarus americanus]